MGWRIAVSLYYQFIKKGAAYRIVSENTANHNAADLNINLLKLFDGCFCYVTTTIP